MSRNFETRRNGFMHSLRSELIRKSSIIPTNSEETKLPPIVTNDTSRQIEMARLSFSRYRNSIIRGSSLSSDALNSIDFNQNLKNLIGAKNLRKVKALFMSRDARGSIFEASQIDLLRRSSNESALAKLFGVNARERFKKTIRMVMIILRLISMHKVSKEKIKKFGNEIKVS